MLIEYLYRKSIGARGGDLHKNPFLFRLCSIVFTLRGPLLFRLCFVVPLGLNLIRRL